MRDEIDKKAAELIALCNQHRCAIVLEIIRPNNRITEYVCGKPELLSDIFYTLVHNNPEILPNMHEGISNHLLDINEKIN